jgi:hypothetical protein
VGNQRADRRIFLSCPLFFRSELGFLRFLKVAKVPLNEFTVSLDRIANVQGQVRGRSARKSLRTAESSTY